MSLSIIGFFVIAGILVCAIHGIVYAITPIITRRRYRRMYRRMYADMHGVCPRRARCPDFTVHYSAAGKLMGIRFTDGLEMQWIYDSRGRLVRQLSTDGDARDCIFHVDILHTN